MTTIAVTVLVETEDELFQQCGKPVDALLLAAVRKAQISKVLAVMDPTMAIYMLVQHKLAIDRALALEAANARVH